MGELGGGVDVLFQRVTNNNQPPIPSGEAGGGLEMSMGGSGLVQAPDSEEGIPPRYVPSYIHLFFHKCCSDCFRALSVD